MKHPEVRVVHWDGALLVLDKPTGLPTTSPMGGPRALTDVAAEIDPDAPNLHASSRLDAEVTGLVTFARTRAANKALMAAREKGTYGRRYLGLAPSTPPDAPGRWAFAIGIDPRDRRKRRVHADGKPSSTRFDVIEATAQVALLNLFPETGRTHQLRVHAAHAGTPLLGDVHYGGAKRTVLPDGRVVTARRTMLHCATLRLPNIRGRGTLVLEAPVPADFEKAFVALGGSAPSLSSGWRD